MRMALFDTHAAIKLLIEGGLQEKTAEAVVMAIKESKGSDISNLASKEQVMLLEKDFEHMKQSVATKADLAEVKAELKTDIAELRTEIAEVRTEIANVQATMLKWYIGSTFIIIGFLLGGFATLLKYLKVL